jgi:hypothetical protein
MSAAAGTAHNDAHDPQGAIGGAEMKATTVGLTTTAIVAVLMVVSSAAAGTVVSAATGSGQFEITSDAGVTALRTFSFEASKSSDGTATGEAEFKNRATGAKVHIRIDCLNVIGSVAVMSGVATFASGPGNAVGDAEIFAVQDNGQGADAPPDGVTRAFANFGLVCTDVTPDALPALAGLFNPIGEGNVQVH